MYGMSLAKNIGGISVGAELSYRHNTPLNSTVLGIAPGLPAQGDTKGPRGDTYHGLVNAVGVIPKTAAVRHRHLGGRTRVVAVGQGAQRRQPVLRRRLRALHRQGQVGRLHHQELLRRRPFLHADLVPGVPRRRPLRAPHLRGGPQRQRCHGLRRQPGQRQLQRRPGCRRAPEVPLRPEIHRLPRPLQGQRHGRDRARTASPRCSRTAAS